MTGPFPVGASLIKRTGITFYMCFLSGRLGPDLGLHLRSGQCEEQMQALPDAIASCNNSGATGQFSPRDLAHSALGCFLWGVPPPHLKCMSPWAGPCSGLEAQLLPCPTWELTTGGNQDSKFCSLGLQIVPGAHAAVRSVYSCSYCVLPAF